MKLIDLHCDTLWKLLQCEKGQEKDTDLKENNFCISIPQMQKAGTLVQFFACFTYLPSAPGGYEECYEDVLRMIKRLCRECGRYPEELALACSYEDIRKNEEDGKVSAVLTVEEGGIVNGKMERLTKLYQEGVRLLTPIWNYENCFGYPNSHNERIMSLGLKPFGKEALAYAGELGMIVDVSHASDGAFWDIMDCVNGPVVASHSNCRTVCSHPRNLTDAMIRRLSEAGGVAGLNFYGPFLSGTKVSGIDAMTAHIRHMLDAGGSEFPAIGTDFDGFDGMEHEDIPKAGDMERLWDGLKLAGIRESQLDGIFRKNAERVLKRAARS